MSATLRQLQDAAMVRLLLDDCADCMDRVLAHFKKDPPVFITVIVRTEGQPTRDFMMTSDADLDAVGELIARRKALGHEGPSS